MGVFGFSQINYLFQLVETELYKRKIKNDEARDSTLHFSIGFEVQP